MLREGKHPVYLLSDHIGIMTGFDLEGAIIRPQVYRCCDTRDATFKYLAIVSRVLRRKCRSQPYHLGSLCTSDREFQIGIFLPVSEEEGEFGEKPIVRVSSCGDGLGARVAI